MSPKIALIVTLLIAASGILTGEKTSRFIEISELQSRNEIKNLTAMRHVTSLLAAMTGQRSA